MIGPRLEHMNKHYPDLEFFDSTRKVFERVLL